MSIEPKRESTNNCPRNQFQTSTCLPSQRTRQFCHYIKNNQKRLVEFNPIPQVLVPDPIIEPRSHHPCTPLDGPPSPSSLLNLQSSISPVSMTPSSHPSSPRCTFLFVFHLRPSRHLPSLGPPDANSSNRPHKSRERGTARDSRATSYPGTAQTPQSTCSVFSLS